MESSSKPPVMDGVWVGCLVCSDGNVRWHLLRRGHPAGGFMTHSTAAVNRCQHALICADSCVFGRWRQACKSRSERVQDHPSLPKQPLSAACRLIESHCIHWSAAVFMLSEAELRAVFSLSLSRLWDAADLWTRLLFYFDVVVERINKMHRSQHFHQEQRVKRL